MVLRRYAIAKYTYNPADHGRLPFDDLIGSCEWEGINSEYVFVVFHYQANNHPLLDARDDLLMFPSLQSRATVFQAAQDRGKTALFSGLTIMGVGESDTASDVVEKAVKFFGPKFMPET